MTVPALRDLLAPDCCCRHVPMGCGDCGPVTSRPCMRVRNANWDVSIPSLWLRLSAVDLNDGYCGDSYVRDQAGNQVPYIGLWSFDFDATIDWHACVCNPQIGGSQFCSRHTPDGWIDRVEWTVGPSCSLNVVKFYAGTIPTGITEGEHLESYVVMLEERIMTTEFWLAEFTVGDWIFSPSETQCSLNAGGPACFRVLRTGVIDSNVDEKATFGPASWSTNECSRGGQWRSYGWTPGDEASSGYLTNRNTPGGEPICVVSWVINADRDAITLMVELMSYNAGLPGWEITDQAVTTFAYVADWWATGRAVGDYVVGPCPAGCEPFACYPACVASLCDSDPGVVLAVSLFLTIDGISVGEFTWNQPPDSFGWYVFTDFHNPDPNGLPAYHATLTCNNAGTVTLFVEKVETTGSITRTFTMTCTNGVMNDIELMGEFGGGTDLPITLTAN